MKNYITILFLLINVYYAHSQSINNNWQQDLSEALAQLNNCDNTPTTGVNPCNKFMGSALKTVYKIDDFYATSANRYMLAAEIADFLKNSDKWAFLGYGFEQKALAAAQEHANAKKAAVAVYINDEGLGHMSVIVPGELRLSGIWGVQVPNSASFFPNDKQKSYVGKSLSYSFDGSQVKRVLIYGRNY